MEVNWKALEADMELDGNRWNHDEGYMELDGQAFTNVHGSRCTSINAHESESAANFFP